jgi:aldehyde dehydrogenase (NAD+)
VLDTFTEQLLAKAAQIVVGRGDEPSTTMGPVCGENQLEGILGGIAQARDENATLIFGGHQLTDSARARGCFIEPTIFADVTPQMTIAREELFGPVLAIMPIDTLDEAIAIANDVRYGLGASIFTRDLGQAMTFTEQIDAGLTHVNMHTAYKEPQLSFGGVKESGHGTPEAGQTGIEFFTEHKTVYINAS